MMFMSLKKPIEATRQPIAIRSEPKPFRIPNEFYPTPPEAVRALLSKESFDGSIWEPACGDGAIAKVLQAAGHRVVASDLHGYGYDGALTSIDFLKEPIGRAKHIVTNPPYGFGLADAFVRKALELTAPLGGKVAMLINMASLNHASRTPFYQQQPPARIYAVDDIVCWPTDRYGPAPAYFAKHRYVWAIWEHGHRGTTTFEWVASAPFRTTSKP
ncbi:MAG: hypothetical protein ABL901_10135 [Hyphomicrobiaceae bacterium]